MSKMFVKDGKLYKRSIVIKEVTLPEHCIYMRGRWMAADDFERRCSYGRYKLSEDLDFEAIGRLPYCSKECPILEEHNKPVNRK